MPHSTTRRFALYLCLTALLVAPVFAQPTTIKVDGNVIKGYITSLASDASLGRRTMTPPYEKAADWAAGKFKEWGLKPAGENGTYFQKVPITGRRSNYAWTSGVPSLVVSGRTFYVRDNDFTIDTASTPGKPVTADVVFVGYGISAPAKGLDEYAGLDVKGRIVLAFKGSPTDAPAPRVMFGPPPAEAPKAADTKDPWADESADKAKMMTAYEKGAAAFLLYNPERQVQTSFGFGGMGGEAIDPGTFTRPFIYVPTVDEPLFKWIMWRDPQESARGFDARVARLRNEVKNKKPQSARTGVTATLKGYATTTYYSEKLKNNFARNVIARIDGTDPTLKAEYVIAGGHLDHNGVTNDVVFNGADDNASGSAVTLEVARVLAAAKVQPKRTLIFALWCGEEEGLLGSNYYGAHPTDGVAMDKTVTYFNMDMVGLGDRIDAPGALNFPAIFDVIMKDQDPAIAKIIDPSQAGPGGSDYSAFIERGIEALALMTSGRGGHPDYHDSGDDPAKIEADILGWTGQFVVQGMLNVANETKVSLIIPDRQNIYDAQRLPVPDMTGGTERTWAFVKASTRDELLALTAQRAKALKQPPSGPVLRMGRGGRMLPVATGVRGAGLFQGSIGLLQTAATLLDFGRLDVLGNDGYWFGDTLTPDGREALKATEAANVTLNLVRPPMSLVSDVAEAAGKPFILTDPAGLDAEMAARLKKKNALVAVECDPFDVNGCVARLDAMKALMGKDNIALSMTAGKDRAEAAKNLYLALVKAGWTKDEIYAMVGVGPAGMMGMPSAGNLSRFMAPPPPRS